MIGVEAMLAFAQILIQVQFTLHCYSANAGCFDLSCTIALAAQLHSLRLYLHRAQMDNLSAVCTTAPTPLFTAGPSQGQAYRLHTHRPHRALRHRQLQRRRLWQ